MSKYVITYDVGTTGVKTCLIEIGDTMRILASDTAGYGLYVDDETGVKGGAEQDADEWWSAMCSTTRNVFNKCVGVTKDQVEGISFCSAMQGLVLVDKAGNCIRRPMTYMDQRAGDELKKGIAHGVQIAGAEVTKLLKYLRYTGAVSSSVKDPIWKYRWVREHEPENFKKVYKWLDVKEYLICRLTGEFVMTQDSAFGTLLYDTRKGHEGWCKPICDMVGVDMKHLPEIKKCTDKVGEVTAKAAEELGLAQGTAVYGGGGDASLIGVGAGAVEIGDAHIYSGTSGWVGTVVPEQMVDTGAMMAAIVGANPETFNYFGELETSNKCVGWVKDHLALDEIGVFLKRYGNATDSLEQVEFNMYDYLEEVIDTIPAGSNGVIFTPWLHGNRCPFEDPNAAGMFFNIRLNVGKTELIRAVVEGICFLITSALLFLADRAPRGHRDASTMKGKHALAIGVAQLFATLPGISRSGSTISVGQLCGLERSYAVSYSFILGLPAVLAAGILDLHDAATAGIGIEWGTALIGMAAALIFGLLAIRLVNYLIKSDKFRIFAIYTLVLGSVVVILGIVD